MEKEIFIKKVEESSMRGLLAFKPHTKKLQSITSPYDCLKEHKTEKNSPGLSTWVQMLQDT